ncbi:hypothetical protein [Cytobacillus praedii]|uniref:hypothetical protein n=1 Tax=Cytobacillus praedii TaxID=1742358 RepID=UPI002E1EDF26|nr:hypothetical protein [Cytobacillus praedii]
MEIPSKEFIFGNTKVIVRSPLVAMTKEERKKFFKEEWEKGNPVLKEIAEAAHDCLMSEYLRTNESKSKGSNNNTEIVINYLNKTDKQYCDDCLSEKLDIKPRQQINQICNKLKASKIITREKRQCNGCKEDKLLNIIK